MRIAVLADIHGNLPAFEAALEHVRSAGVDQIIIAGDIVVGSPDSAACLQLARELGCPIIRGNHERYVFDFGGERADPLWSTAQFAPLHWAVQQLGEPARRELTTLPASLRLPDAPELLFVHASLRSDNDSLRAHTPEALLAAYFPGVEAGLIVRAHNHVGATRIWGERLIVTSGSIGLALDGSPTAQYLLLERRRSGWRITHQSVPYDLDRLAERFHSTGYLEATGPIGRLYMREVLTASFQIVPFLRFHQRLLEQGPMAMGEALERFLAF
jgi:predicted phosphodiesterase